MATYNASIAQSSDDARQTGGTGFMTLDGTTLALLGGAHWIGLRFTNVTIPPGSTINSAVLDVNVTDTSNDDPNLDIYCDDSDNAATFTSTNNDISGRSLTTAKTTWNASSIGSGSKNSPSFAAAVQEVIDRPGWSSGNAIAVLLDSNSSGPFTISAYDHATDPAPSITIDYTPPSSGATAKPKTARIRLTTKVGGVLAA